MFVHSAQTHGAMLELKNQRKKFQYFFDFYLKMGFSPIKEIKGKNVPLFKDLLGSIK